MSRLAGLLLCLAVMAGMAFADTTWVAGGNQTGIWSADHSPYMIQDTVTVAAGNTLTINAGVTVYFTGPYRFNVRGTLRALGTVTDSIRFTTDTLTNPARWRGLRFLSANGNTLLRYCVVEYGYATHGGEDRYGGGIECRACAPRFENCAVRNCYSLIDGGAVYCRSSANPSFYDCEFSGCFSEFGGGAGLFSDESSPVLVRCVIRHNRTLLNGGGVCFVDCSDHPTFTNCIIDSNTAVDGGGIYVGGHRQFLNVVGCRIRGNVAQRGGGAWDSAAHVEYLNCVVGENTADSGGGIFSADSSCLRLNFCTVTGNHSGDAAIFSRRNYYTANNSIVTALDEGAAIHFVNALSLTVGHCDVFSSAGAAFSGTYPQDLGRLCRRNVWRDSVDTYFNLRLNPLFVAETGGDYRLCDSSHCLAAALDASHTVSCDIDSLSRPSPHGSYPDMGAFENPHSYPNPTLLSGHLFGTLGPGEFSIVDTVSVAVGDSLVILPGTRITFLADNSFQINGLLRAHGTEQDSIYFMGNVSPRYGRGLWFYRSAPGCTLSYCRLSNSEYNVMCNNAAPAFAHCLIDHAGDSGIECNTEGNAHFWNCVVRDNATWAWGGGGMECYASSPLFVDCNISNNRAGSYGGGMLISQHSQPTLTACTFDSNRVYDTYGQGGGALYFDNNSAGTFTNCLFRWNADSGNSQWDHGGGAVSCSGGSPVFDHCIFYHNSAQSGGAASLQSNSAADFRRCTFVSNIATGDPSTCAGAIWCSNSHPVINSSLVCFSEGPGLYIEASVNARLRGNNFYGNTTGDIGYPVTPNSYPPGFGSFDTFNSYNDPCDRYLNVSVNPFFADTAAQDYHLITASHCIDAGDPLVAHDPDSTIADIGTFYVPRQGHPPSQSFTLISPANNSVVNWTGQVGFIWHRSEDPDYWDLPYYYVHLVTADTTVLFVAGRDTARNIWISDFQFPNGTRVRWWVEAHTQFPAAVMNSDTGSFTFDLSNAVSAPNLIPSNFALHPASPNPFNPATRIAFDIAKPGMVSLRIFDMLGRQTAVLVNKPMSPGWYSVPWNAADYPSGMYFAILNAGGKQFVEKMVLIK